MDRKPSAAVRRTLTCPRGVSVRGGGSSPRLQIAFSFLGTECRELLAPGPMTQSAIAHAAGLRNEILNRIALGTFIYRDYFPESPRASQFDVAGRRVLVKTLLENQLESYRKQVANDKLSPSTLEGYEKIINSGRMAFWDEVSLAEATPAKLREFVKSLDVTSKRARNLLTPLRSVFEDALDDELITLNPFARVSLDKLLRQTTKSSEYEVDPFDAVERAHLLAKARPDEAAMVRFWFGTGLRPGELIALRWPKVEWGAKTVRIDRNFVAGTEKGPKTAAGVRDVELDVGALAALEAQKPLSLAAGEHIWLNPRTGKAWESDAQIRKTLWQPLCKRAEVRYRNPYQARHTFASSHLTAGANPWWVAGQLGHVDVQLVFKIYGKFIAADFKRAKTASAHRREGEEHDAADSQGNRDDGLQPA